MLIFGQRTDLAPGAIVAADIAGRWTRAMLQNSMTAAA
jgi:hypothetical protein